ncbi:MAG: helix-turn-helix domain-containing protein, partial [Dongiaceae bacterium]
MPGLEERPRGGRPPAFHPRIVVAVKALACELPTQRGRPLARWSVSKLQQAAAGRCRGLVAQGSG